MNIDELHDKLFDVLCVIDDICKKENVRYFIAFGTAIGAIREKDYIAWDDDMDLEVLIDDYDAFYKAMKENLPPYMRIIEPKDVAPAFYDFVIRIVDDRYLIRKETEEDLFVGNIQNHVGTDVFITSKLPNGKLKRSFYMLLLNVVYGFAMGHRHHLDRKKYSLIQWLPIAFLATIGKLFKTETLCKWWMDLRRFPRDYIATDYQVLDTLADTRVVPASCYEGETQFATLRGREFPLPSGYHEILTRYYGDYMTPPQDFERYIKHSEEEEVAILKKRWEKRMEEEKNTETE